MLDENYGQERWAYIPGYEGYYMISDRGRVKSVDRYVMGPKGVYVFHPGHIMKQHTNSLGYKRVNLSKDNKQKKYSVHRLVAEAFVPHIRNGDIINHKDENPSHNMYFNLEWADYLYNNQYNNLQDRRFKTRSDHIKEGTVKLGKSVVCLNDQFDFVKEYTNAEWTKNDGFDPSGVRAAAKRRKVKTYKKYYWLYLDEYNDLQRLIPKTDWQSFLALYLTTDNCYNNDPTQREDKMLDWFYEFCGEKRNKYE